MPANEADFLEAYGTYVRDEVAALKAAAQATLRTWQSFGYWSEYAPFDNAADPKPIHRVLTRIKRPESVLDKIKRLPDKFPTGASIDSMREMRDFLGSRIVTFFPLHLAMIDREIRNSETVVLSDEFRPKSYLSADRLGHIHLDPSKFDVKGRKPSGYSSIHYTIALRQDDGSLSRWFELQTRTMLEETWAAIEHQLGYKPDRQTEFSVRRQFRVISEHLEAVDTHFDFLYDHLTFLQSLSKPEDDALLNAENLPSVLNSLGVGVEQGSIGWLLDILETHGIQTVGILRTVAKQELVDAVMDQYAKETGGKTATAKDVVPVLAKLPSNPTTEIARAHLRSNLQMTRMTEAVRAESSR